MDLSLCQRIIENMQKVIVGKDEVIRLLLTTLLADGHALLEDVPGLGKTLIAKSLALSMGGIFKRLQFTPDLLPSDVTGFKIFNQQSGTFVFQPGPVMSNVLLADEINRTIQRTQASLLESMEERQVTVDGETSLLPTPFFVIATQNPIEQEGTFPLPEAQLDRFLLRIHLGYPSREEEIAIMARFQKDEPLRELQAVATPADIVALQKARREIHVAGVIHGYIADIVRATREAQEVQFGASPRGALGLLRAGQAYAALQERDYVLPDDIQALCRPVLCHRLVLREEERFRGTTAEQVIDAILARIPVPVDLR
jgi:MoxR-like ATPase